MAPVDPPAPQQPAARPAPAAQPLPAGVESRIRRTAGGLFLTAAVVFCFGYALVPLYDVFCEWTGIRVDGDTPARVTGETHEVDFSRQVQVEFDVNLRDGLPWEFQSRYFRKQVRPGEFADAVFLVTNRSGQAVTARAVPSIAPIRAAPYFKKTECFCFVSQRLQPGESREMRVRFLIDPKLPEQVSTITLSYSFFAAVDAAADRLPGIPAAGAPRAAAPGA